MNTSLKNRLQFLSYVKSQYPGLYSAALAKKSGGLSGLGITVEEMLAEQNAFAEPTTPAGEAWYTRMANDALDIIKQLTPVYVGTQQAKTCLQINAERAKQGLPMIDCASSGLAPQFSVGMSPDVKTFLYIGLAVVGGIFLLNSFKKR